MTEVVIVSGARTPVGSFNGAFASVPAHDLGKAAIEAALTRAKLAPKDVSEVILGQILTAAQGQNPARQASINAGIPVEAPAWIVNQLCGSGLRAVALGYQQIMGGDASIVVAGGQESMSQAPHAAYLRAGQKMGGLELIDTMLKDGLIDAFHGYHMGVTAENVAREWQITREQQDQFRRRLAEQGRSRAQSPAASRTRSRPSRSKSAKARRSSTPTNIIRDGVTYDGVSGLKPAFQKDGTVTAANASGINDGAAAVVLMSAKEADSARAEAAGADRLLGDGRRRSRRHGHGSHPGLASGAEESRLVRRRSRPHRGQRGLRGAGLRGQQGAGLGYRRR